MTLQTFFVVVYFISFWFWLLLSDTFSFSPLWVLEISSLGMLVPAILSLFTIFQTIIARFLIPKSIPMIWFMIQSVSIRVFLSFLFFFPHQHTCDGLPFLMALCICNHGLRFLNTLFSRIHVVTKRSWKILLSSPALSSVLRF